MDADEARESFDLLSSALDAAGYRWIVNQALAEIDIVESDEDAEKVSDLGNDLFRQTQLLSPRERLLLLITSARRAAVDAVAVESNVVDFFTTQAVEHSLEPALFLSGDAESLDARTIRLDAVTVEQRLDAVPALLGALAQLEDWRVDDWTHRSRLDRRDRAPSRYCAEPSSLRKCRR